MERMIKLHIEHLPEGVYLATSDEVQGLVAQGRTIWKTLEIFMNRRDDCAGTLFATNFEEGDRSRAYGRPTRNSLRAEGQARARQHL